MAKYPEEWIDRGDRLEPSNPRADRLRDIADSAIVAIERAFQQARLSVEGKPLTADSGLALLRIFEAPRIQRLLQGDYRAIESGPPATPPTRAFLYRLHAYAWFAWLFAEGLIHERAWTSVENADYNRVAPSREDGQMIPFRGFNPWPVNTPEEDLGSKVFFAACRVREDLDRVLTEKKHPSGWGLLAHRGDMLEAIRTRLNWPATMSNHVAPPPGQWPKGSF